MTSLQCGVLVSSSVPSNSLHKLPRNSGNLSIFYYNARSILPKLNNLAATCHVFTPDIVCIVESWLCSDICDSEISLVDYSIVRLNRSCHGGGIILYIKNNLNFDISHGALGLELIFVSIFLHNNRSICLRVFFIDHLHLHLIRNLFRTITTIKPLWNFVKLLF